MTKTYFYLLDSFLVGVKIVVLLLSTAATTHAQTTSNFDFNKWLLDDYHKNIYKEVPKTERGNSISTAEKYESLKKMQWTEVEIGNNVFVKFPHTPEYNVDNGTGTYISKTENCVFVALIQYNVIPPDTYNLIIKQSSEDQKYVINKFLDGTIKGQLYMADKSVSATKNIILGKFLGREVSYSEINPVTGENNVKYSRVYFILNKVYTFNCYLVNKTQNAKNEKDAFFSSVNYKR